jgi:hypothetical protein
MLMIAVLLLLLSSWGAQGEVRGGKWSQNSNGLHLIVLPAASRPCQSIITVWLKYCLST